MTMGTSIMRASLSFTSHTPAPLPGFLRGIRNAFCSRGLTVQKIEGLFAADSTPDSIQRSIPCQTSADCLRCLIRLSRQRLDLAIDFFISDEDFLLFSDFVQQQSCLHFMHGLLLLPRPQPFEIQFLHVFG